MKRLRVASFFAGIGGFDLGFERAGFDVVLQCEIQNYCSHVLKRHWPQTSFVEDISTLGANAIPEADVWCGGFPCQDLSVARGSLERRGLNGSRSGLFFRLASLAKKRKPRAILIENVHGLLNSNQGKDFAQLLHELDKLGYAISWRLLNSRYFGLPQSRPRVFICAWYRDPIAAGNALFEEKSPTPSINERDGFLETSWTGQGPIAPKTAFCLSATSGRHTGTDWSRTYIAYRDEVRRLTPLECERLQGFPDNWTSVDEVGVDIERVDSLRYHALGNAVSVSVVKWIADRIRAGMLRRTKESIKSLAGQEFGIECSRRWPGLQGRAQIVGTLRAARRSREKIIWPNAGILWNGTFISNRTPTTLHQSIASDLRSILEQDRPDERYFLSSNAAEGILRRVDSQERELFIPLRRALERLARRDLTVTQLKVSRESIQAAESDFALQ
jgi:DNA (cytosine-5)-methyltransferase 1